MPPPTNALDRLAPDQRAAVELVLRQGRSYGELANVLGLPEDTIRARTRGGLEALAPDLPPPPRAGEVADWLLGQQAEAHAARTRELVAGDPATRRWAETVAEPLRELAGDALPAVPSAPERPPRGVNGAGGRPLPPRDAAPAESPPAGSRGASSRLGGAILIGALLLAVAGVLAFVLTRGDEKPASSASVRKPASATATATPAARTDDIVLRGPAGSQAVGLMRLFRADDDTVRFALAAQGVAPNATGQRYSIWFRKRSGAARLLGDVKDPVGKDGTLTAAGPGNADVRQFPAWFATYDAVLVTVDGAKARNPGKVVLSGDLPHAASG